MLIMYAGDSWRNEEGFREILREKERMWDRGRGGGGECVGRGESVLWGRDQVHTQDK